jgi:hypothetical protein
MADQGQHNDCVTQAETMRYPEAIPHFRLGVSEDESWRT